MNKVANMPEVPTCDRCNKELRFDFEKKTRPAGQMSGKFCDECYDKFLKKANQPPVIGNPT